MTSAGSAGRIQRLQVENLDIRNSFKCRCDGGIIGGSSGKGFLRQPPLGFERKRAAGARKFISNGRVIGRGRDHGNIVKILSSGANHRRSTNVDILDQFFKRHARLRGGLFKGVEIDHDHVDRQNSVLGNSGDVRRILAAMQNAAMHLGMQRLDPAIEHFRKSREFGDVFHGDAGIAQHLGRAPGGDEFDAEAGELAREIHEASLVGNAENGALDAGGAAGHDGLGCEG